MLLEEAIPTFLLAQAPITAIVGARVYGLLRPQGIRPLPEILVTRASTLRARTFCGTDALVNASIQIDCYAMSLASAAALAKVNRDALIDFRSGEMGTVYVDDVSLTNEFAANDPEPGTIRIVQLFSFWYLEA